MVYNLCVIILFSFSFFNEIKIHFENLSLFDAYELFSEIFVFLIFSTLFLFILLQFILINLLLIRIILKDP